MIFDEMSVKTGLGAMMVRGVLQACSHDDVWTARIEVAGVPVLVSCDILITSSSPHPELEPGDVVMLHWTGQEEEKACILGKIGSYRPASLEPIPTEVLIEATQQMVLRCGEGQIVLRGDGKVLVRGRDLVNRAKRSLRLKGGSVAIN